MILYLILLSFNGFHINVYMKLLLSLVFFSNILSVSGQESYPDSVLFSNHVFNDKIKTVQLYNEGWNLSYPLLKLKGNEKLLFSFDLTGDHPEAYDYTFIHCDKDWNKSDISPNDYIEGYTDNHIEDYQPSFNTTVSYFHYKLSIPNEKVKLTLSGNYILEVYPADQPGSPAITQRFLVTEEGAKIDVSVHRPQMTKDNNASQQVDFNLNIAGLTLTDPNRTIYAFILQNGRWDNCKKNLKPEYFGNTDMKYNSLSDKNIFQGGNEYRYFDIKSIRHQSEYVRRIDYAPPYYNVYLAPSDNREFKPYFYSKDFNGKYYVAIQEGKNPDIDADYVNVFFTLPSSQRVTGGNMYVSGGLNNWSFDKNNLMTYNDERKEYECTMLLKQGWYNYEYVFLKKGSSDGTATLFEGSHYETENDYTILIYYRNPRGRYDRLIGSFTMNTLNRLSN
jgi:hypothetical protein